MWRDSMRYMERALEQFERLAFQLEAMEHSVVFSWVENSSKDGTRDALDAFKGDVILRSVHDDCRYWESIDHPERWRHLSWVANHVLEQIPSRTDRFIYVESDLRWDVATMLRLLHHLGTVEVVSPLNRHRDGWYYDTWGSTGLDGVGFTNGAPFHQSLARPNEHGLVEVASVAGCTAMVGSVARSTRFGRADCYLGWNREMRDLGYSIWCDPTLSVFHD